MLAGIDGYLLDTDTVTLLFRGSPPAALERRIREVPPDAKWVSVVTIAEMLEGAFQLIRVEKGRPTGTVGYRLLVQLVQHFRFYNILDFDDSARSVYQAFPASVKRIGRADCEISASAIDRNLVVVTRNLRHFQAIPNVQCEDWTQP